ncbi:MAG: hypothetical protein JW771_01195 [Candidatus Thermoplasmatota archaeon]|nr:hypothetical protein [Candidatus Thermoplasmatota archaeon]
MCILNSENEYQQHITDAWQFASTLAAKLSTANEVVQHLALVIFEKCVSPHHYFLQNTEMVPQPKQPLVVKPTSRQIKYALSLGIQNPEAYSKEQLSQQIQKVVDNG